MNKEHYYRLLENPKLLSKDSLEDLENLISSYPYVTNFRILYALNLLILDDFRYQKNLHKAAFHSSDRKKLKHWVNFMLQEEDKLLVEQQKIKSITVEKTDNTSKEIKTLSSSIIAEEKKNISTEKEFKKEEIIEERSAKETQNLIVQTPPEKVKREAKAERSKESEETRVDPLEEKKKHRASKSKTQLLQLVRKRLAEIEAEKKGEQEEKSKKILAPEPEIIKAQLIDRFIEDQPSISRPDKKDFYNPHKEAVDSTIDEDEFFVTETLAQIHRQQGNIKKALEIYQKLILKNPEKSTYFAAQIQELSKNN